MRIHSKLAAIVAAGIFTIGAAAIAAPAPHLTPASTKQAETQSATGTIASVTDNSIAINLRKGSNGGNATDAANSDESKTLQFVVNTQTKIDGKPVVGSLATIEYKIDKDNNMVAVHVTVQA